MQRRRFSVLSAESPSLSEEESAISDSPRVFDYPQGIDLGRPSSIRARRGDLAVSSSNLSRPSNRDESLPRARSRRLALVAQRLYY